MDEKEMQELVNEITDRYARELRDELAQLPGVDEDDIQISLAVDIIDREAYEAWMEEFETVKEDLSRYWEWRSSFDPNMN